jgi:hypothetical protein
MGPKRIRLIKNDEVNVNGSIQLGPSGTVAGAGLETSPLSKASLEVGPQEARIVESNSEFAILEVVCGCGCKSQIQCHYVNA